MVTMTIKAKRIDAEGRAVYDVYSVYSDGTYFLATVSVRPEAPGGLKVLLGALQPIGKERAWDAIRAYEQSLAA